MRYSGCSFFLRGGNGVDLRRKKIRVEKVIHKCAKELRGTLF